MTDKKIDFEYVFSGTNMMNLLPFKSKENHTDDYNELKMKVIEDGVKLVKEACKDIFPEFNIRTSILFNAYVETKKGPGYNQYNNVGFDSLYADSGGLQVITQGAVLDDEMKRNIYEIQKHSEYAFCFDEIPVEIKDGLTISGGGRSNYSMKQFDAARFKECAIKTGQNVYEQLQSFEGTNTKAFQIIQGNTYQDMIDWMRYGAPEIKHLDKLAGLAPSVACMGNGELESCDMLMACKTIFDEFEDVNRRLHLLGFGAPNRLLPAILLMKSGFLENINVSFDSSSNAMAMMMGNYKIDGLGVSDNVSIKKSLSLFVGFFDEIFKKYIGEYDQDELVEYIFERIRYTTKIEDDAFSVKQKFVPINGSIIPLYCTWLNIGFFKHSRKLVDENYGQTAIGLLSEVHTVDDYLHWRRQFKSSVKSVRMYRKRESDLGDLFG